MDIPSVQNKKTKPKNGGNHPEKPRNLREFGVPPCLERLPPSHRAPNFWDKRREFEESRRSGRNSKGTRDFRGRRSPALPDPTHPTLGSTGLRAVGPSLRGPSSALSSSCSVASAWPYTEAWPGPCGGLSPSAGCWWWHTGTERPEGVQEAEADFSPAGVPLLSFLPLSCPS